MVVHALKIRNVLHEWPDWLALAQLFMQLSRSAERSNTTTPHQRKRLRSSGFFLEELQKNEQGQARFCCG